MKLGLGLNINNAVSGEWTPAKLSSLLHWYKFNTGITRDGEDDVTAWNDQKGSNNLTADGTGAASPTYDNGAVLFNSSADILTFGTNLDLGTFAIYVRMEASAFDGDFLFEETSNEFIKIHDANTIRMKIAGGTRHDVTSGVSLSADTKFNIGFEREDTGSTTDDQIFVFLNNVSKTIGGSGGGTQAITDLLEIQTIGQPTTSCKYYEVIICNNVLSSSDRTSLNTYLNEI
jgi:hypothetical protein